MTSGSSDSDLLRRVKQNLYRWALNAPPAKHWSKQSQWSGLRTMHATAVEFLRNRQAGNENTSQNWPLRPIGHVHLP